MNIYQIHIKTDKMDEVKAFMVSWLEEEYGVNPIILSNQDAAIPFFNSETPTYFALCEMHEEWITILHDSYDHLMDFTSRLSSRFNTIVIHALGQSTVDTYHLTIFYNGNLLRKFDVGEGYNGIEQYGDPLPFEKKSIRSKVVLAEEDASSFDYDDMQEYCLHFNLDILVDPSEKDGSWEVLHIDPGPARSSEKIPLLKKIFLRSRKRH